MRLIFIVFLIVASVAAQAAGEYRIDWSVISSGGGVSAGGAYRLAGTVGQPAAGYTAGGSCFHWIGFWAGDVPTPVLCASLTAAKSQPDGAFVSVAGKVATSAIGDYPGFFYVQEADRYGGIRVACAPSSVSGLERGKVVNVIGTMGTTADGERQIAGPMVIITPSSMPINPLGVSNRSLGGGDATGQLGVAGGAGLNNVGLLVRAWGYVSYSGSDVLIDDGSGVTVKLDVSTLASPPAEGSFVTVTGISALHKPGADRLRLILPRDDDDIAP